MASGQEGSHRLEPIFDKDKVRDDIHAQMAITAEFGKAAAKAIGDYASGKHKEALLKARLAQQNADGQLQGQSAQHWQEEADRWSEGGIWRTALHAAAGALAGNWQGALGAAAASTASPLLESIQDKMQERLSQSGMDSHSAREIAKTGTGLLAAALGAATGAPAAAAAAFNKDFNNRQITNEEQNVIKKLAAGDLEKERRLSIAACALVQCSAQYDRNSELYAQLKHWEEQGNSAEYTAERELLKQQKGGSHGYASVAGKPLFRNDPLDHALDRLGRINNTYQVLPRALGLVQAGAGAAQSLGGSALTAIGCAGTAGAGCLGSALIGIPNSLSGADNVRAGLDTALSGKPHATFGALALSQATGWRAEIAELVYGAGMASGPAALALWQRTGKAVQAAEAMANTAKAADKADDVAKAAAKIGQGVKNGIRNGGTIELFTDARGAQVPGAVGVGPKDAAAIATDARSMPNIPSNSQATVVANNPLIPKEVGGTGSIKDFLPEVKRITQPGGKVVLNMNEANPNFKSLPSEADLKQMGFRIEYKGNLLPEYQRLTFKRIDGSDIAKETMRTIVLVKD